MIMYTFMFKIHEYFLVFTENEINMYYFYLVVKIETRPVGTLQRKWLQYFKVQRAVSG
jgi:hypothetical protein